MNIVFLHGCFTVFAGNRQHFDFNTTIVVVTVASRHMDGRVAFWCFVWCWLSLEYNICHFHVQVNSEQKRGKNWTLGKSKCLFFFSALVYNFLTKMAFPSKKTTFRALQNSWFWLYQYGNTLKAWTEMLSEIKNFCSIMPFSCFSLQLIISGINKTSDLQSVN